LKTREKKKHRKEERGVSEDAVAAQKKSLESQRTSERQTGPLGSEFTPLQKI